MFGVSGTWSFLWKLVDSDLFEGLAYDEGDTQNALEGQKEHESSKNTT